MPEPRHTAENDAPTCRSCYAATLTPDERDRFNAEPVTSCIYLCPTHQEAIDRAFRPFMAAMFDTRKTRPIPPGMTP
jgi:hypothetical protein